MTTVKPVPELKRTVTPYLVCAVPPTPLSSTRRRSTPWK